MVASMLSILQKDYGTYNQRVSEAIGKFIFILLLILGIVWLIKRFRKR
jgi:flagellar biogenesis protein FliO